MRLRHVSAAVSFVCLAACTAVPVYNISDVTDAREVSNQGLVMLATGDTDNALNALNAVIAYGSINDADYARRAAIYGTRKNYDLALADANRAIELAPKAWRRYLERAVIYQRVGSYEAAIVDLDSAVALQPNTVELLRRRAYLKVVASRFDDAVADYEELTRMLPRSDTGALGRGAALYLAGRWSEASQQFADMLKARPNDGLAALWLAKARLRGGQFLAWDEVEPGAGNAPEWRMVRALLTVESEAEVTALVAPVETCERTLFLGLWRMVHNDNAGATREFNAAQKACPLDSIEASETRAELARLQLNKAVR